jgi:hypothetical protein
MTSLVMRNIQVELNWIEEIDLESKKSTHVMSVARTTQVPSISGWRDGDL